MPPRVPRELTLRFPTPTAVTRVVIGSGALDRLGALVRSHGAPRAVVVSDARVAALHGGAALRSLARAGIHVHAFAIPRGEGAKRARTLERLWDRFAFLGLERGDAVVALGGGVVGDLAGFAAASFLRGVPWISVPTTVVAQADSGIGGKTGIDLRAGKNLAGAFHQPRLVVVDPDVLQTLPPRQFRAGMAEVIKTGMAVDRGLFEMLERDRLRLVACDRAAVARVVARTLAAKARVVQADEREREGGPRTALNFGHTLGHALEAALGYRGLLHGEAVAIGMRVAARLSEQHAGLAPSECARLETLLDQWRLPRTIPGVPLARIREHLDRDKKRRGREVRWVLTPRMGHASVPRLIPARLVQAMLLEAGARA